jgi:hypothetical protein
MKRFIILCVLFIVLLSSKCSSQDSSSYVFYRAYSSIEVDTLKKDFFNQLEKYNISTTDLEKWNDVQFTTDDGYIKQRFITKKLNDKTFYVFIWSYTVQKDSVYYEFKIRKDDN